MLSLEWEEQNSGDWLWQMTGSSHGDVRAQPLQEVIGAEPSHTTCK